MRRWWSLAVALAGLMLVVFVVVSRAEIAILDPALLQRKAGIAAAPIGALLLIADVFLPVPSSLVMVANGALFGTFGGTVLSLIGSTGAALTAFAVGRAGTPAIRRVVTEREHERAASLLARWGVVAIAFTRPIPILAETVAILAGSSPLRWRDVTLAAAAGSLVPAAAYSWAGASAEGALGHTMIFAGVIAVTALLWLAGRPRRRESLKRASAHTR